MRNARRASTMALVLLLLGGAARAGDGREPGHDRAPDTVVTKIPVGGVVHLFGGLAAGRGLRFDNPYRLQTELGSNAQSVSLSATYLDAYLGAAFGGAGPIFHGAVVHGSFATDGIPQEVVTPSYLLLVRPAPRWGVVGRVGLPIVIEPDANVGFEMAAGGQLYLTAAVGLSASLVGSLFYGAATLDTPRTAIPILSFEAGAFFDYEVLP
jgi:hypothetical protein